MVTVINEGSSKEEMEKALGQLLEKKDKKGFDSKKHCGKVKFMEDGLALQKKWRDEWR